MQFTVKQKGGVMHIKPIGTGLTSILAATAFSGIFALNANAQQAQPAAAPANSTYCRSSVTPYLNSVFLAYIKIPASSGADSVSEMGLTRLADQLTEKTSLEDSVKNKSIKVTGLDIENDDICFFPFIYWPITAETAPLSAQAQSKVQTYLNRGGFIMFDVRDAGMEWRPTLKTLLGSVNLGAMAPLPEDHTVRNTFYKNSTLPGSLNMGPVYVQIPQNSGGDKFSQIIVGERNWAGAWAGMTVAPSNPAYEQTLRAGINAVIYALTGNYKGDQPERVLQQNIMRAPK